MSFYSRILEESPYVFKDGSFRSREEFLNDFKYNPDNQLFISVIEEDPVGLIWFNRFQLAFAQGHFCFFKKYWGNPVILEAADRTNRLFFKYNDCGTVIGITSGSNARALNFLNRMGARTVGIISNGYLDAESGSTEEAVIIQFMRSDYEDLH